MGIISKDKKPYHRKICDLTIVADHTFYQEVGDSSLGTIHILRQQIGGWVGSEKLQFLLFFSAKSMITYQGGGGG